MHATRDEMGGERGGMTAGITRIPAGTGLAARAPGNCPRRHYPQAARGEAGSVTAGAETVRVM